MISTRALTGRYKWFGWRFLEAMATKTPLSSLISHAARRIAHSRDGSFCSPLVFHPLRVTPERPWNEGKWKKFEAGKNNCLPFRTGEIWRRILARTVLRREEKRREGPPRGKGPSSRYTSLVQRVEGTFIFVYTANNWKAGRSERPRAMTAVG